MTERLLILFYNPGFVALTHVGALACADRCCFTDDVTRLPDAAAVIFHIPTLRALPPVKSPGQCWVAWSLESAVNYPALADPAFMRQFDITMSFRRDATIWWPYFGPETAAAMLAPPRPKTETAPVVHFRSSPIDRCGRTDYAAALMRRVKVDSYGKVLHNRDMPGPDVGWDTMIPTTARYKFALVLENSIAEDYVSDKFYCALMAGSVPVYRGAPNAAALAPAERCFIDANDFAGPAELAAYLNWLDEHDAAYQDYLAWRAAGLSPAFQAMLDRLRDDPLCRLCAHLRSRSRSDRSADAG